MTIPALPSLDRTSPTFKNDLDALFLTQMPATFDALNAEIVRIDGITPAGFVGTSTTSLAIASSGTVTLTTQANKGFAAGQVVLLAVTAAPATQMQGIVSSYNATTGELVFTANTAAGSGTYTAWTVSLTTVMASPYNTGDIALTNRALSAPSWLPADGSVYAQSSYAALYAELGLLRDGLTRPFVLAGTLAQTIGTISQPGEGVGLFPLLTAGTTWMAYNKAAGVGNNRLARSTDGGVSWSQATLPNPATDVAYTRIVSHNSGATLVAIHASTDAWVARSTDNGATWATVGVAGYGGNGQLFVVNGTYVLLSAAAATSWTSADGSAWTSRTPPAALTLLTVSTYSGSQVATAVSGAGPWTTLYTTSDGITWTANTIASVSSGLGYAAAMLASGNNTIIWMPTSTETTYRRSTNGGATWTSPAIPEINGTRFYPVSARISFFDGRFVFDSCGTGRANIASSTDGLTWQVDTVPIPVIDENVVSSTYVVGGELWMVLTSIGTNTVYILPKWGKEWVIFNGIDTWQPAHAATVQEMGGVQMYTQIGVTQPRRRSVYTYNTATQFAVPTVTTGTGVTAYIKA